MNGFRLGLLFSLLAGLSFFARHLIGFGLAGGRYGPLAYDRSLVAAGRDAAFLHTPNYVLFDETTGYARHAHEILRAEWAGPNLASYRPYVQGSLPPSPAWYRDRLGPAVTALLVRCLAGNTPAAFAAADFLLPALLAATLLWLGRRLGLSFPFAAMATALFLWLSHFDLWWLLVSLRTGRQNEATFLRTPNPQVCVALFGLLLVAALRLRDRPAWTSAALLAGALVLNFHAYFFAWTLGLVFLVLWLVWDRRRPVFPYLLAAVAAALLAAFPVWSTPLLAHPPVVEDCFWRLGGQVSRRPDWIHGLPVLLLAALSFAGHRRGWPNGWFWTLYWTACAIALNQQILTGRQMQSFHYVIYFAAPFAWIFLGDLVSRFRRGGAGGALVAAVLLLGLTVHLYRLTAAARQALPLNTADESLQQLARVLREPSLRPYGFLTNDEYLIWFLPGYLPQKPLQPWYVDPLTNAEIRALDRAAFELSGYRRPDGIHTAFSRGDPPASPDPELQIRFDPGRLLLIANRHRPLALDASRCRALLANSDFLVFRLSECLPASPAP